MNVIFARAGVLAFGLAVYFFVSEASAQWAPRGGINLRGGWITSDPEEDVVYRGRLTLVDNGAPAGKRPIHAEEWKIQKRPRDPWENSAPPPETITHTMTVRATGLGQVHLRLRRYGAPASASFDVGSFRSRNAPPQRSGRTREFRISLKSKMDVVRSYQEPYYPSKNDSRAPIQNRGLDSEIAAGTETLYASGVYFRNGINVVDASETWVQRSLGIEKWPPKADPYYGYGEYGDRKWVWWVVRADPTDHIVMSYDCRTFTVELLEPLLIANSAAPKSRAQPIPCPACGAYITIAAEHAARHKSGLKKGLPMVCRDTASSKGCGHYIYHCPSGGSAVQEMWHKERICTVKTGLLQSPCKTAFRHCNNAAAENHKGAHSDGSQPKRPKYYPYNSPPPRRADDEQKLLKAAQDANALIYPYHPRRNVQDEFSHVPIRPYMGFGSTRRSQ